jgi:hypothetical protein
VRKRGLGGGRRTIGCSAEDLSEVESEKGRAMAIRETGAEMVRAERRNMMEAFAG